MQIHQVRNATIVMESRGRRVLVDPMLGPKGSLPPYTLLRYRARKNPLIDLPANADALLGGITHGLITHTHHGLDCDHLDRPGCVRLKDAGVPVYCRAGDERALAKRGIDATPLAMGERLAFLDGTIRPVPAAHGRGIVRRMMGDGAGYVIRLPDEPTVYLTGDTILTDAVRATVRDEKPDVIVAPLGGARLDVGGPILITLEDAMTLAAMSDATFVANHLEALNHCPVKRADVLTAAANAGIAGRIRIPQDGETIELAG